MRHLLLPALSVGLALMLSCASTGSSSKGKQPPATYDGLDKRTDVRVGDDMSPKAIVTSGWKRDPDMDPFLGIFDTEEEAADFGARKARVQYVAYSEPGAEDLRIGAWRHRRWWVEPEWEELTVLRTDLAFGRAPGAKTLTRLRLTPRGVTEREETDFLRFEWARIGDKPSESQDRRFAILSEGTPGDIALLDEDYEEVARIDDAAPEKIYGVACGYLVAYQEDGAWYRNVVSPTGEPLREPFPYNDLWWYTPPPIDQQADRSMSYQATYMVPVDAPNELRDAMLERLDATIAWPISKRSEAYLAKPDDCIGALRISSRTWAVWWRTPAGVRLAFSDSGDPDVEDLIASRNRAQWVDWQVLWYQLTPHSSDRWILAVAQEDAAGERSWRAFFDAECTQATFLGFNPRDSLGQLERQFAMAQIKAWEDQERIDAERAEMQRRREEAERIAAEELAAMVAAREAEEAERLANTIWMEDCQACDGKGFLMSTQTITTNYSPLITYRNGIRYTERTSITSTQPRYGGICGVCKGSGWVEVK
ncbi:MAG: hypothetical protein ACYS26_10965 [Planctomycetota bacterium]|jgi:hypothetical protein